VRIVLDTNVLVRAAANEQGLAGKLLQEIVSGPHVLVSSPYILSEVARVLNYARLQARWHWARQRSESSSAAWAMSRRLCLTTTPDRIVLADPDDDPVVQTAALGGVDVLCTRDAHLLDRAVVEYCAGQGIQVMNDIDLYHILTGRPKG